MAIALASVAQINPTSNAYHGTSMPAESWGYNQSRVTRHANNTYPTVRVAYPIAMSGTNQGGAGVDYGVEISARAAGSENGAWSVEAQIKTQDDFFLLRDPITDAAYLICWPDSIPTIYTSTDGFTKGSVIPGKWVDYSGTTFRHYGGAAISPITGDIVLKASVSLNDDQIKTANTASDYIVGKFDTLQSKFIWGSQQRVQVGERFAYDWLFPTPLWDMPGIYGVARRDVYRTNSPYGFQDTGTAYVFDGFHAYKTGYNETTSFKRNITAINDPLAATRTYGGVFDTIDAIVTKDGYLAVISFCSGDGTVAIGGNGGTYMTRGYYLTVYDRNMRKIQNKLFCANMETYGNGKFIEDSHGRLFFLLIAHGARAAVISLYSITRSGDVWTPQGSPTSLGSQLGLYAPTNVRVISQHGGNARPAGFLTGASPDYRIKVDLLIGCRNTLYDPNADYVSNTAYANGDGRMIGAILYLN